MTPLRILAAIGIVFGLASIYSGGSVLLGGAEVERMAGRTVPWIVWFNTLSGPVYVVAGLAILGRRRWAFGLVLALVAAIAVAALGFVLHVIGGGGFEPRTVGAMTLRLALWTVIALLAWRARTPGNGE